MNKKETRSYKDYKADVLEQLKKGLEENPLYMLHIANRKTPHNPVTKTFYRGINFVECAIVSMYRGYKDSRWYTMKNIVDMGLHLKAKDPAKGYQKHDQLSTELMYFIPHYLYELDKSGNIDWTKGRKISEAEYNALSDEDKKRCRSKTVKWWVYNGEQIDGLEPEPREEKGYSIDLANHIASSLGTSIEWDSNKEDPCYSSKYDKVYMPDSNAFDNENEMNAVALHELSHSTGHKSRLDRKLGNRFGSEEYAFEELVAECSATMLCAYLGIEPIVHDNHKAYVKSWLGALKDDPNALLDAFKMAERSQQYIIDKAELEEYEEQTAEVTENVAPPVVPAEIAEPLLVVEEPAKKGRKASVRKKTTEKKQIVKAETKKRTRKAEKKVEIKNSMDGLNIVITGKLQKFGRKTAFTLIKNKGGIPSDSLTKETNVLVIADEKLGTKTDKVKKAEKYGTKILSEADFYSLIFA